jgi:hypothetical protein
MKYMRGGKVTTLAAGCRETKTALKLFSKKTAFFEGCFFMFALNHLLT